MRPEDIEYFSVFLKEFQAETDRGTALVGAALLDKQLHDLLRSHFLEKKASSELLEGGFAPLGTFSARAKVTYCLGLITDYEYRELQLIRKVRNVFAHQTHGTTFQNAAVASLCGKLHAFMPEPRTSRLKFIDSVICTSLALWYRPEYAADLKAKQRQWPYPPQAPRPDQ